MRWPSRRKNFATSPSSAAGRLPDVRAPAPGATMRALLLFSLLVAFGCNKSGDTNSSKPDDVKSYLNTPVNKPAFEKAILGRSTREVTDMLGPPKSVVRGEKSLGWVYRSSKGESVILMIDNDRVSQVDWGGA